MRPSVNDANKFLRQTVKSVEAGGVATLARAMEHPGILQEVHVTTLDASDAEIPAASGLSAGVKLPTRIESKNLIIIGKFPVATQAEYDALSDAMKDQSVVVTVDEAPIGSELKAYATDSLGNVVGCTKWIMGQDGWTGVGGLTLSGSTLVAADPIVAPSVNGLSLLPDGSTSFARPIVAPNTPLYPIVTSPRTVTQRLRGDGMRVALHGSSTLATGSTYQMLGGATGDRNICTNSLIWALNAEGAEIDEVWNGAFAGDKTEAIHTKFLADWATIKNVYDVHVYAPAFNNLTDPTDDLSASKPLIVSDITRMIRAGKRVIWILPFAGNPLSYPGVTHQKYADYIAWAYSTIESLQAYRGQILPWNLYSIFNAGGVDLPLQYAAEQSPFAQHLSSIGAIYAARHPSSKEIIRALQIPRVEGADIYGTPVAAINMMSAIAGAGAVIASAGNDPDTGEPMYDLTSSLSLSYITTGTITVNTAKVYRIVGEYELTTLKTADGDDYVDGVKWEDPVAQRIGVFSWIYGNSTAFSRRVTGRVKVFGPKWAPSDTSGALRLFIGPPGAVVRVRGNTPIRLYEVPA